MTGTAAEELIGILTRLEQLTDELDRWLRAREAEARAPRLVAARQEQERDALLEALAQAERPVQELQLLTRDLRSGEQQARAERRADLEARAASLTRRELDVLRHLAAGKTNPEIGRALGLSPKAARNRVAHVLAKLGVPDRTQAAVVAIELGLANPS